MIFLLLATPVSAQETEEAPEEEAKVWKFSAMLGVNLNVTSRSSNWSGDEKNTKSWLLKFEGTAERDGKRTNWLSKLKDDFGQTKLSQNPTEKSADILFFDSILSLKSSMSLEPYVSFNLQTQNDELFNPSAMTEAIGIKWTIIKGEKQNFNTRLGAAAQQVYDSRGKDQTGEGPPSSVDDPDTPEFEEWLNEIGAEWVTNYDIIFLENSKFVTELRIFTAFENGALMRWDNSLYFKLNKILTMQFGYILYYNKTKYIHPVWPDDIQQLLTIALGISYNLF
jgi:hypothetical protein